MILVRRRGHGQPGVIGEQRDHGVDVGGDVRVGETPGEGAFLHRPWPRCPPVARFIAVVIHRSAGALQGALDRGLAGVEHAGHLAGGEAEHVA